MLERIRSLALATAAAGACAPALAQPPTPCSEVPFYDFDGTAENLLGISSGFVGEYCQDLDLTPLPTGPNATLCTNGGLYFVVGVITGLTYHVDTPHPIFGDVRIRRALAFALENDAMSQPNLPLGTPPPFPLFEQLDVLPFDQEAAAALLEEAGWVMGDDGARVCQGWDGSDGNQAIPADVGAGLVNDIHATFDGGQTWERVQDFPGFENYRAALAGLQVAPIGGSLTGDQVVPTPVVLSPDKGMLGVWDVSGNGSEYTFYIRHDVSSPGSAELRQGGFGESGPLIFDLGIPTNPILASYSPPDPDEFERLVEEGLLYLQVNALGGSAIRTNLAFAERRLVDSETFTARVGLTHPGTFACYDIHHSGGGDESVRFDMVGEELRPFANGTLPRVDENEIPRGGPIFSFELGISTDAGPPELFPAGFFEPGTGTPLTDGCIEIGVEDPLDANRFAVILEGELTTYSGGSPVGPPVDAEEAVEWYRDDPTPPAAWKMNLQMRLSNAAGQGYDGFRLDFTARDGIFGDGFRGPDTNAWDQTVGGP